MEKLILLGIAMWINFGISGGFQPSKPVKKPDKQKIEISRPDPIPVIVKWKSGIFEPRSTN
jgi:hypothetical protein